MFWSVHTFSELVSATCCQNRSSKLDNRRGNVRFGAKWRIGHSKTGEEKIRFRISGECPGPYGEMSDTPMLERERAIHPFHSIPFQMLLARWALVTDACCCCCWRSDKRNDAVLRRPNECRKSRYKDQPSHRHSPPVSTRLTVEMRRSSIFGNV